MSSVLLEFAGMVPNDPMVAAGGCELGGGRCTNRPELVVLICGTGVERELCRGHAGYFMLAATSKDRATRVLVRQLE